MKHESYPENIMIIFLSGIGNFILFIPTLQAIRKKYPQTTITLLTKLKPIALISKVMGVDKNIIYAPDFSIIKKISLVCSLRKKYDIIITTFEAQGWKLAAFIKFLGAKASIGYKTYKWFDRFYNVLLTYDHNSHEIDRHLEIAKHLGAETNEKSCTIPISTNNRDEAEFILAANGISAHQLLIGMHPGSSGALFRKRWPAERFAKVSDRLWEKYRAQIIILGGPDEVSLAEKIAGLTISVKPICLAGKTNIMQTAAIIQKCDLFVTNDSGLMHIAAAVNTPTVAIFGPTNPKKNAPIGKGHIVIRKELPCSPCLNYNGNKCREQKCLEMIAVDDVMYILENNLRASIDLNTFGVLTE